ncbi:hypothetical protein BDV93DRAFT_30543 [Ceratobasidium sp. AG-I]|nr:hypothetical protein BDV93DRAFT_30543 [Ceratobasidium sp. AG-I]
MLASTAVRAPGGQISRIPELLNVILAHLNRPDQARLMRVSRPLFHCAGALIWRDIVGITKLFSLLPGAAIRVDRQNATRGPHLMVIIIKLPDSLDFTRFELYARFIRSLDLPNVYEVRGQRALRDYRGASNGVILPNLVSLTCQYGDQQNTRAAIDWINLFLSPSLLNFSVTSEIGPSEFSSSARSKGLRLRLVNLMRGLPQRCPNLEEIHIPTIRNSTDPQNFENFDLHESLALLSRLRIVSGSEMLLEPQNLTLLGALPHLEYLAVHSRIHRVATLTPDWPVGGFPALRRLQLHGLGLGTICSALNIKALAHKLTDVDVHGSFTDPGPIDQWPRRLFRDICIQSIHITNLSISFAAYASYTFKLSSEELNLLRQLPLQSICLKDVQLGTELTHLDFILAVPETRVLRLPSQPVKFQDLHFYAMHLPNLEILSLMVIYDPKSRTREESFGTVTRKVIFEITQGSGLNGHVLIIASRLCSLWPGIQCATFSKSKNSTDQEIAQKLNIAIVKCRGKRIIDLV